MFRAKIGWTKEKIMAQIMAKNLGYAAYSDRTSSCFYRQDDGNCCLVGAFIPEDHYDSSMEDNDAEHVINEYALEDFMPLSPQGMEKMQRFHDSTLANSDLEGDKFYAAIESYIDDHVIFE